MATFPALTPTARSFKPGTYPQRTYRSLAGVVVRRTFGNSPSGATLDLSFDNVSDAIVASVIDHYRSQTAANQRFNLNATVTAGMDATLAARANASIDGLRWEYDGPPEVESVRPGINKMRVALIGEIRNPQLDD